MFFIFNYFLVFLYYFDFDMLKIKNNILKNNKNIILIYFQVKITFKKQHLLFSNTTKKKIVTLSNT
jgi:hypothetical protein